MLDRVAGQRTGAGRVGRSVDRGAFEGARAHRLRGWCSLLGMARRALRRGGSPALLPPPEAVSLRRASTTSRTPYRQPRDRPGPSLRSVPLERLYMRPSF